MRWGIFLIPLAFATAEAAQAEPIGFGGAPIGLASVNFESLLTRAGDPGRWEVVVDDEASGGRAVAQLGEDATDDRFPMLVWRMPVPADVELRTRIKPVSGKVDQAGGLVVRLLDRNTYYLVRANALENNVRFYKVTDGRRVQLASADVSVKAGIWQELKLRADGPNFTISFAGRELFRANDAAIRGPGRVGLWTKADSITRFDALSIDTTNR